MKPHYIFKRFDIYGHALYLGVTPGHSIEQNLESQWHGMFPYGWEVRWAASTDMLTNSRVQMQEEPLKWRLFRLGRDEIFYRGLAGG